MVSLCTKFEVSVFTRYKAVNGGAKCRKWGGYGSLRVILRRPAQFREDRSSCCSGTAIFDFRICRLPPPLTVSCFSKIQIGFTFLVPAHPGSPGKRAVKRVCVCVCVDCSDIEFFKIPKFSDRSGHQYVSSCQISSKSVKLLQRYRDLTVFKMAAILGF